MTGKFGVRWCLGLLAASLATIAMLAGGCPPKGQESCGRKDMERQTHQNGHTVHQRCEVTDDGSLVWTDA